MKADDRPIVEAISRGSKAAFVTLFEFTSGAVRAEVAARLPHAQRAAPVFAATYVEVWWLAGCHCRPGVDVVAWIGQILDRRIADADACVSRRPLPTSADHPEDPWPSRAELELAALLGRPCDTLWPA
jgi:hypothetical protein